MKRQKVGITSGNEIYTKIASQYYFEGYCLNISLKGIFKILVRMGLFEYYFEGVLLQYYSEEHYQNSNLNGNLYNLHLMICYQFCFEGHFVNPDNQF